MDYNNLDELKSNGKVVIVQISEKPERSDEDIMVDTLKLLKVGRFDDGWYSLNDAAAYLSLSYVMCAALIPEKSKKYVKEKAKTSEGTERLGWRVSLDALLGCSRFDDKDSVMGRIWWLIFVTEQTSVDSKWRERLTWTPEFREANLVFPEASIKGRWFWKSKL